MSSPDRISPTRRPDERVAGYQSWRSLLFMHWPAPVDAMRKLVPRELELDLWQGTMWVGVVPFLMEGIRPWRWWPRSLAFAFPETNVRTYVVHNGRPGVFFLSLEAASWLAVQAARIGWSLPYFHATLSVEGRDSGGKTEADEGRIVRYESRRRGTGVKHSVRYRIGRKLGDSEPGTLEHFLLERYLLFVKRRGRILSGQVYHTPYPAHEAEVLEVEDQLVGATGLPPVTGLPTVAHYSPGVDVEIYALREAERGRVAGAEPPKPYTTANQTSRGDGPAENGPAENGPAENAKT